MIVIFVLNSVNSRILSHNRIEEIADDAFEGLHFLKLLELNDNRLTEIPFALEKLTNIQEL